MRLNFMEFINRSCIAYIKNIIDDEGDGFCYGLTVPDCNYELVCFINSTMRVFNDRVLRECHLYEGLGRERYCNYKKDRDNRGKHVADQARRRKF